MRVELRLIGCAIAIAAALTGRAMAEDNGSGPHIPSGGVNLVPPTGPGGGGGGPCTAPPLPPDVNMPSHARGILRETCGGVLRPVANKPIEVILRVKQQPMICDPNNIPPPYFFENSVARGSTAADGTFDVVFFASSANLNGSNLLLELKVRIRLFADDGVTPVWETAYYGTGVGNEFFVQENIIYCLTEGTRIRVVSPTGAPSFNAEVFVNGRLHPERTNPNGMVTIFPPAPAGSKIVARALVHESQSLRSAHDQGSTQNWRYRAYITSLPVKHDANGDNVKFEPVTVTDPNGAYVLGLSRDAAYIGLHLVAAIEWDASSVELSNFASKIRSAGEYVFNATDGQMLIERVDVFDDKVNWSGADWRVYADLSLRAHVDAPSGGFWLPSEFIGGLLTNWMHMSRSNDAPVYIHEFGHYGMRLKDEYKDDHDEVFCAANAFGTDPQFAGSGSKASCMMFNQWSFTKICSKHAANPHREGTRQGDEDCWSEIKRHFTAEAPGPNGAPRWRINTPVDRGVIVGRLPSIPVSDWTALVEIHDANNMNLCQPVNFTWVNNGGFANGARVFTKNASGRSIIQGTTDATGQIKPFQGSARTLAGLHTGDTVGATWYAFSGGAWRQFSKTRIFTDSDCANANVILLPAPGQLPPEPQDLVVEGDALLFSLTAQIEPSANAGAVAVRVRAGDRLGQAPVVRCTVDTETAVRVVTMALDNQTGDFIGAMGGLPAQCAIVVEVEAQNEAGAKALYLTSATLTTSARDEDSELSASDGLVEVEVPAAGLPATTPVAISGAVAALPAGFNGRVICGPVAITTAGAALATPATLRFALPFDTEEALRQQLDPARLIVMAHDDATGNWTELAARFNDGRLAVDSQIARFGSFVLLETGPTPTNPNGSDADGTRDLDGTNPDTTGQNPTDGGPAQAPTSGMASPAGGTCGLGIASAASLMMALVVAPRLRRNRGGRDGAEHRPRA